MPNQFIKISGNKKIKVCLCFRFFIQPLIYYRQNDYRQRSSRHITNWQLADKLYKRLFERNNSPVEIDQGDKHLDIPQELRPVGGPINIEQLPAMLAARYVKRYPYSQYDDPAVM